MWWPARSEAENALRETVQRLLDRYRERLADAGRRDLPLRGVGAGRADPSPGLEGVGLSRLALAMRPGIHTRDLFPVGAEWWYPLDQTVTGPWYPLILVDAASMPPVAPEVRRLNWREIDPDSPVAIALRAMEPPPDCLVEPVGPIAPAVAPGCVATAAGYGPVTAGLPVSITDPAWAHAPDGFLTVAHGVPDPGQSAAGQGPVVTVVNRAGSAVTGEVAYWDESARTTASGDDIALVALTQGQLAGWIINSGTQGAPPGPPYPTLQVDLYAGQSKNVLGQVTGALRQLGDQTHQWEDLWDLGTTTPVMQHGDSGSLAVGPASPHSLFGHFVGGAMALPGRGSGFTTQWVQDLEQVLTRQTGLRQMITF